MKNILILAPHPDDEILGCGGVMANYIASGMNVYVAVMGRGDIGAPELFSTEGTEQVRKECLESHALLGVKETFFLDFPTPRFETIPSYQISIRLSDLLKRLDVTDFYVPHRGDIHKDHQIAHQCALVAARPIGNYSVKRIYAYETISETEWAAPAVDHAFIPTRFVNITESLSLKIAAFKKYKSQLKSPPHPRSVENIENYAKMRGSTVGVIAAEAFMVIREIVD
jgi:LmbE family N-acetylglucosaminyl deacetylase